MTYREAFMHGEKILQSVDIVDAKNDAWLLMTQACHIDRTYYFVHMDEEIEKVHLEEYLFLLKKRAEHVPLQYLTGEQEFMGLSFLVNENVLIPRQDTETLVEQALKVACPGMHVLDMCTGSGCILISILKNAQGTTGLGVDISRGALNVAKENAKRNNVTADFERSDLFDNVSGNFDMIVSNPPYIRTDEIPTLMPEVMTYEPMIALDGLEDGLHFYRKIVAGSKDYLKEKGWLLFEIGYDQGDAVSEMMRKFGYMDVAVIKDLCDNDRVVMGHL